MATNRPAGRRDKPNAGSWNAWLASMEVGEVRWVETTLDEYPQAMRTINTPLSRRPATMKDLVFTCSLFTAVSASAAGDIRYLISVERIE